MQKTVELRFTSIPLALYGVTWRYNILQKDDMDFQKKIPSPWAYHYYNMIQIIRNNKYPWVQQYPLGTTMRPHLAVELTNEQIFWVRLKHFYLSFTIIYGEN